MSRQAVQRYQHEIAHLIHYGGSTKETAIRGAFQHLLTEYCRLVAGLLAIFIALLPWWLGDAALRSQPDEQQ